MSVDLPIESTHENIGPCGARTKDPVERNVSTDCQPTCVNTYSAPIHVYTCTVTPEISGSHAGGGATDQLTKTSPLTISPQLFHSKSETLLFNKSYPDSFSLLSLPTSPV